MDLKILEILTRNAKKPYSEIANLVHVSGGTVHVRMRKLGEMGIVKGATLDLNLGKLGYDITAFIGIFLAKSSIYDDVLNELKNIKEITNIHYTTGNYSMFCKIHCRGTEHLKEVLHDKIQKVNGITRTETIISLEESLNRHIDFFHQSNEA